MQRYNKSLSITPLSEWVYFLPALSLASDKKKLLKEVTTMLSLKHPNVMSLTGMCFDGEIPLLIMPYMSKGSVLVYVKQNKRELFLDSEINDEKVCTLQSFVISVFAHERLECRQKIQI